MKQLQINPELKRLIPPLSSEEFAQLEKNCLEEGIRDPLIAWNQTIVDGHNRYEIAQKHGLEFEVLYRDFDSEADAKLWMIDNQNGRRNLSDFVKYELAQVKAEILREKGREKMSEARAEAWKLEKEGLSIIDKPIEVHDTRREVAVELGWSTGKVAMADVVNKKADEETKEKVRRNELSINKAYQEIKTKERREKQEQLKQELAEAVPEMTGVYNVIYADPPWQYDFSNTSNRDIENHYPTMTIEELCAMNIPSADNSVLYMWATAPKLTEALKLMEAWGFNYKTHAIWDKEKMGMGYWFRGQHELLMVGVKGQFSPPIPADRISSVIRHPRGRHSEKPEIVYNFIESSFAGFSKLELFARNTRKGWASWGNEIAA